MVSDQQLMLAQEPHSYTTSLLLLPYELTSFILSLLDQRSVYAMHRTCRQLKYSTQLYVRSLILLPSRLRHPFTGVDMLSFDGIPRVVAEQFRDVEFDVMRFTPPKLTVHASAPLERAWKSFLTNSLLDEWRRSHIPIPILHNAAAVRFVLNWEYRSIMEEDLLYVAYLFGVGLGRDWVRWRELRSVMRWELRMHAGFCAHGVELEMICFPCLEHDILHYGTGHSVV